MKNIKRINITIDEDLLNKVDSYLKNRYLSRSGLISLVLSSYLDYVFSSPISSVFESKPSNGSAEV